MKIYLDNCATTRVCDEAAKAVWLAMTEQFANPSSLHTAGQEAELIMKHARRQIAFALNAKPESIIFTGSGTESDNLAVFSAFFTKPGSIGGPAGAFRQRALMVSAVEHPAVLRTAARLNEDGVRVETVPVMLKGSEFPGMVDPRQVRQMLDDKVQMVSMQHVNNEIGTIQPIDEIGRVCRQFEADSTMKIRYHVDCVQSFGKLPVDVLHGEFREVDFISVSAHKIHGPKGVGALYAAYPEKVHPMLFGGGQEGGKRSGTENVPGIAGFAVATKMMISDYLGHAKIANSCRRKLLEGIKAEIRDVLINSPEDASVTGKPGLCSPYILNVSFLGTRGEVVLHELEKSGIFVSTGAACSSLAKGGAEGKPTGTLAAIGLNQKEAEGALRFGFSIYNTSKEMEFVVDRLKKAVARFRQTGSFR
ncbi:MAG: cysteine desulfurase [Clostridiales Family XIII bacterium]|jgi:cysteine desulfurase|nr:cysteine desulfurase [Clostridiales Family XIII bacterium]